MARWLVWTALLAWALIFLHQASAVRGPDEQLQDMVCLPFSINVLLHELMRGVCIKPVCKLSCAR